MEQSRERSGALGVVANEKESPSTMAANLLT